MCVLTRIFDANVTLRVLALTSSISVSLSDDVPLHVDDPTPQLLSKDDVRDDDENIADADGDGVGKNPPYTSSC